MWHEFNDVIDFDLLFVVGVVFVTDRKSDTELELKYDKFLVAATLLSIRESLRVVLLFSGVFRDDISNEN